MKPALPPEMWMHILSFLEPKHLLLLSAASRELHSYTEEYFRNRASNLLTDRGISSYKVGFFKGPQALRMLCAKFDFVQAQEHSYHSFYSFKDDIIPEFQKKFTLADNPTLQFLLEKQKTQETPMIWCVFKLLCGEALLNDWFNFNLKFLKTPLTNDNKMSCFVFALELATAMHQANITMVSPENKTIWQTFFINNQLSLKPSWEKLFQHGLNYIDISYAREACPLRKEDGAYTFANKLINMHFYGACLSNPKQAANRFKKMLVEFAAQEMQTEQSLICRSANFV